jgi:hypothetical protein
MMLVYRCTVLIGESRDYVVLRCRCVYDGVELIILWGVDVFVLGMELRG